VGISDYPHFLWRAGAGMNNGGYVLIAVLLLSLAFGIYRKVSDGKLREEIVPPLQGLSEHLHLDHDHPPQVTFLQFSSEYCQPCRVTTKLLDEVTNSFPAICHIELDVVEHMDLVKTYGITRTPTTLIIDKSGTVHFRATGVPKKAELTAAVTDLVNV
jgi:thiol-disulfide isomerase/thioredoxin